MLSFSNLILLLFKWHFFLVFFFSTWFCFVFSLFIKRKSVKGLTYIKPKIIFFLTIIESSYNSIICILNSIIFVLNLGINYRITCLKREISMFESNKLIYFSLFADFYYQNFSYLWEPSIIPYRYTFSFCK